MSTVWLATISSSLFASQPSNNHLMWTNKTWNLNLKRIIIKNAYTYIKCFWFVNWSVSDHLGINKYYKYLEIQVKHWHIVNSLLRMPETPIALELSTGHHQGINKYYKCLQILFKYCYMVKIKLHNLKQ